MPTEFHGARSPQHEQIPEPVTPDARADTTAEVGAEGGSYGDLTQSARSHRESGVDEPHGTWRLAPAALAGLFVIIAVILAVTFWAVGG